VLYTALVEQSVGREAAVDIAEILERNVKVKNTMCCVCFVAVRFAWKASPNRVTCRTRSRGSATRESALSMTFMRGDDTGTEACPECSSLKIQGLMYNMCTQSCACEVYTQTCMYEIECKFARVNIVVLYDCWEIVQEAKG
jgi:hypothetical protein